MLDFSGRRDHGASHGCRRAGGKRPGRNSCPPGRRPRESSRGARSKSSTCSQYVETADHDEQVVLKSHRRDILVWAPGGVRPSQRRVAVQVLAADRSWPPLHHNPEWQRHRSGRFSSILGWSRPCLLRSTWVRPTTASSSVIRRAIDQNQTPDPACICRGRAAR